MTVESSLHSVRQNIMNGTLTPQLLDKIKDTPAPMGWETVGNYVKRLQDIGTIALIDNSYRMLVTVLRNPVDITSKIIEIKTQQQELAANKTSIDNSESIKLAAQLEILSWLTHIE